MPEIQYQACEYYGPGIFGVCFVVTDGFQCQSQNITYRGYGFCYGAMAFSPGEMLKYYIYWVCWQIQSAFHEQSTLPLVW